MAARITKAQKAEFAAYAEAGGKATIRQYLALQAGRSKMLANRAAKAESQTPKTTRRGKRSAKQTVQTVPVSQLLRAPAGVRCDFMGGHLVIDEAGANQASAILTKAGLAPKVVGSQTSKRRGLRIQVDVSDTDLALSHLADSGFRVWAAA